MMLQLQATPLHHAAGNGHGSVVEYLITSGANVNAVDVSCFIVGTFIYTLHDVAASSNSITLWCWKWPWLSSRVFDHIWSRF